MASYNNSTPKLLGLILFTAVTISLVYVVFLRGGSSSVDPDQKTIAEGDSGTGADEPTVDESEETQTFAASETYKVPGHDNTLNITVDVSTDKTITAIKATHSSTDEESLEHTDAFDSAIKSAVVGKKIDVVNLSDVGGASLTTDAFNDVIDEISAQIK